MQKYGSYWFLWLVKKELGQVIYYKVAFRHIRQITWVKKVSSINTEFSYREDFSSYIKYREKVIFRIEDFWDFHPCDQPALDSPSIFKQRAWVTWESQVLLTDGQVVFLQVLWFSPTFDEQSARYKWNILERAIKPERKKKSSRQLRLDLCRFIHVCWVHIQSCIKCCVAAKMVWISGHLTTIFTPSIQTPQLLTTPSKIWTRIISYLMCLKIAGWVANCRPWWCLIWVCTVCSGLSVQIHLVNTVHGVLLAHQRLRMKCCDHWLIVGHSPPNSSYAPLKILVVFVSG